MKILFYADPARIYDMFLPSLKVMLDHLLNFFGRALLRTGQVEIRAVMPSVACWQAESQPEALEGVRVVGMSLDDLRRIFAECRSLDEMQLAFFRAAEVPWQARLADWFDRALGGWEPDVVLAFPTETAPLRRIFPRALALTVENGVFSRMPFPRSLRFEPVGFMNGFLSRYRERIWNFPVGAAERTAVQDFCRCLRERLAAGSPCRRRLEEARARYRRLALCPVPARNFYGEAHLDDPLLWLDDVLGRVPGDIGVIATFHDNIATSLNERTLAFLRSRHPNLLTFGQTLPSAFVYPFVDAILNCETMTGTQGMLVCPHVVSLDRSYSAWMAEAEGPESLERVLAGPAPDRTALVYWYLTHFTVCEYRFDDADWLLRYFSDKLASFRADGLAFETFGEIEPFARVADWTLSAVGRCQDELAAAERGRRRVSAKVARRLGAWLSGAGARLSAAGEGRRA